MNKGEKNVLAVGLMVMIGVFGVTGFFMSKYFSPTEEKVESIRDVPMTPEKANYQSLRNFCEENGYNINKTITIYDDSIYQVTCIK